MQGDRNNYLPSTKYNGGQKHAITVLSIE